MTREELDRLILENVQGGGTVRPAYDSGRRLVPRKYFVNGKKVDTIADVRAEDVLSVQTTADGIAFITKPEMPE